MGNNDEKRPLRGASVTPHSQRGVISPAPAAPKPRKPWSYASSKREAEAWASFADQQFPSYERFWHLYVEPRTRRAWSLDLLPGVSEVEGRVARLHTHLINKLYNLDKPHKEPINERQERLRLGKLRVMAHVCDNVELFLFLLLFATGELPESHPVYQQYLARRKAHRAAAEAANAPFKGRPLSLDEIGSIPRIPYEDILPEEVAVVAEHYNLATYTPLAAQIRHGKEAINKLPSLRSKYFLPTDELMVSNEVAAKARAQEDTEIAADVTLIQELIAGYPSVGEYTAAAAASLTAEIDRIWGEQVIPLALKHAQTPQKEPVKSV